VQEERKGDGLRKQIRRKKKSSGKGKNLVTERTAGGKGSTYLSNRKKIEIRREKGPKRGEKKKAKGWSEKTPGP